MHMLTSLSVDEILLSRMNWSTNSRGLPLKVEMKYSQVSQNSLLKQKNKAKRNDYSFLNVLQE